MKGLVSTTIFALNRCSYQYKAAAMV